MSGLFEVRLPAGDVLGFDVGVRADNGPRQYSPIDWLSQGYDGVRFIGQGKGITHIRPALNVWTNITILQHNGIVQLEDLTLHNAPRSALQAGMGLYVTLPFFPKFKLVTRNVELLCDVPGKWGFFTYECDRDDQDLEVWGAILREHPSYAHGFSKRGLLWDRVIVHDSGAEACKYRPDPREIRPIRNQHHFIIRNSEIAGWFQEHSHRGGAGTCIQGAGPFCDVLIEKTVYWGGHGVKCRSIMIDDGWYTSGTATGSVILRNVGARGSSDRTDYGDTLIRVGPLNPGVSIAKSLTIEGSSLWGTNMAVQIGGVPTGKTIVRTSNTERLRDWANAQGMDTTFEAQIPRATRRVPVSEGLLA